MTTCIRRPHATWTTCTCDSCRADRRRTAKRARNGLAPVRRSDEAWALVDARLASGWSLRAVASAANLPEWTLRSGLWHREHDGQHTWTTTIAETILASAPWPAAGHVPAVGVRRRLQALAAIGWTVDELHARSGIPVMTMSAIRAGKVHSVLAGTHARIRGLYDELHMRPGPSPVARAFARRNGWAAPLDWDAIDEPGARPAQGLTGGDDLIDPVAVERAITGTGGVDLTRAEREAALVHLVEQGLSDAVIAGRLGVSSETVLRERKRLGLVSKWKPVAA